MLTLALVVGLAHAGPACLPKPAEDEDIDLDLGLVDGAPVLCASGLAGFGETTSFPEAW